jgi:hypothetical protein
MAKLYITLFSFLFPLLAFATAHDFPENTTDPDSAAMMGVDGHARCTTHVKINCTAHTLTLSAHQDFLFTGASENITAPWSTGQNAHQIIVTPPGTWSWDPTGFTCDHVVTQVTYSETFFLGQIDITGPPGICAGQQGVELNVNTQGYNFDDYTWTPANNPLTPITIDQPGNYSLIVHDAYGCPFADQINLPFFPPFVPQLATPPFICPEGDSSYVTVTQPFVSYAWSTGDTGNPLLITEPGLYEVTVTNANGCTGNSLIGVQNGAVQSVILSATKPAICPGQLDTLRVLGAFLSVAWSNGVNTNNNIVNMAGSYTVTVTNNFGCSDTANFIIGPLYPPVIQTTAPPLCLGGSTTIAVTGGNFPQYTWSSGQSTSSITTSNAGTYTVTVSGPNICPATTSISISTALPPVTAISPPGQLTCTNTALSLDAGASSSGSNFVPTWTTLGGNIISGQNSLTPLINGAGTYTLTLLNATNGCTSSATVMVDQNTMVPVANAGLPDTLTCDVPNLTIGVGVPPSNPNYVPVWTTVDGNIIAGQNTWNPLVNEPGIYVLTVNDTSIGCSAISSVTIDLDIAPPVAQIATPGILSCIVNSTTLDGTGSSTGSNYSYLWSTANGSISGANNGNTVTAAGIGTYQLLVTNTKTGCTATSSITVTSSTVLPVAVAAPPPLLNCIVSDITIDASASSSGAGYTYTWTTPNGTIQSGENTLMPVVTDPGTYNLLLVNTANSCTATVTVIVNADILPPAAVAGPDAIINCFNLISTLNGSASAAGPDITYLWTSATGNIISGNNTLTPVVDQQGIYQLLVTNQTNGCTATASAEVQGDFALPVAAIAPPVILTCITTQASVNGSASSQGPGFTYSWTGTGILSGQGTPQINVNQPGVYNLLVSNTTNGCTRTEQVEVLQNISAPTATAGPDVLLNCKNLAGNIGDATNPSGPAFTLQWTTIGGNFTSPTNGPTATINAPGTYQLIITANQNGCTEVDNLVVTTDFVPPMAEAGNTAELNCVQNIISLAGSGSTGPNFTYQWTTSGGNFLGGPTTLTPLINAAGNYNLLVTNTINGCTSTDQVLITQSADVPVAIAGAPQTLTCTVTAASLNGAGSSTGLAYTWSTATGNIVNGGTSLTPLIDAPGTYVLTVVNNTNNCSAVSSVIVSENIVAPQVNAGPDKILTCTISSLPLNALIVASSSPNISYAWSSADGQIISGAGTATPTIGAIGTYVVTVTDISNGCTGADQMTVNNDLNQPVAVIAPPSTLTCTSMQATINTAGSSTGNNFNYSWTTTNGNIVSLANPAQPVVNQPGTYNLVITNSDNGCTETAMVMVPQNIVPPVAEAGQTAILDCNNTTLDLNGNGSSQGPGFTYTWSTITGQINGGINTLTPQIGAPGTYVLSISNTQNGCTQTDNVVITQNITPPVANIPPPALLTCSIPNVPLNATGNSLGTAPTFQWTTSNGNIVSGANTLHPTVNQPGQYTLTIENTVNGCTTTLPVTVAQNIVPPTLQLLPSGILTCTVEQLTLGSLVPPQTTLSWSTTNGNIVSGANTPAPVVNEPGLYAITVTSTINGCTTNGQLPVLRELNVPTGLQFMLHPPLCNGTPGILMVDQINGGVGPFQYSINGGQSFFPAQEIGNLQPGGYDLVVRDANGCKIMQPIDVPEPPKPLIMLPPQFKIFLGENQELHAHVPPQFPLNMIDTVIWSPLDGLTFTGNSIPELLNPVAQPFITTKYEVTIITPEGCKSVSRTTIEVDRRIHIYAPNVIDPLDPNNSTFLIFSSDESIKEISLLQVYDRWGAMVFENREIQPNDVSAGWKGDHRGEQVQPAVFVWQAEVLLVDGEKVLLTGDVTVVR